MYVVKTIKELKKDLEKFKDYKLCYIDKIEQTYSDWDPETKKYMETEQYKRDKEFYGFNNPNMKLKYYPNPDYIRNKQENYAFFCSVPEVGKVWGDDFDDAPYDCNSGIPYDTYGDDDKEITVIKVPFSCGIDDFLGSNLEEKYPNTGFYNTPYSVEDINLGAVPWIFVRTYKGRGNNDGISIMAGTTIPEFIEKLGVIHSLAEKELRETLEFVGTFKQRDKVLHVVSGKNSLIARFYDENFQPVPGLFKPSDFLGYEYDEIYETYLDDREWRSFEESWDCISKEVPKGLFESIWNFES